MAEKKETSQSIPGGARVSVNLTPKEAALFLQKLASDDEFRRAMEKAPRECLAEYHVYIPQELVPEQVKLPSKEELTEALASVTAGEEFRVPVAAAWVFIVFLAFFAFFRK